MFHELTVKIDGIFFIFKNEIGGFIKIVLLNMTDFLLLILSTLAFVFLLKRGLQGQRDIACHRKVNFVFITMSF